jgi:hypothetical protein
MTFVGCGNALFFAIILNTFREEQCGLVWLQRIMVHKNGMQAIVLKRKNKKIKKGGF